MHTRTKYLARTKHLARTDYLERTNYLALLPYWISWWLGYRRGPPRKRSKYIVWLWSAIGAFGGLSILQAVFGHAQYFINRNVPTIIPSYGASAVLIYGAIEAPLAQPRAFVGGHFLSALVGVCITKLFHLSPHFESIRWAAGSLSTAVAIVVMQMTATTHPPAGATALLAAVNDEVVDMGWYYLPVILLSCALCLATALLVNNIQRRYPVFWFTPHTTPPAPGPVRKPEPEPGPTVDIEKKSSDRNGAIDMTTRSEVDEARIEEGDEEEDGNETEEERIEAEEARIEAQELAEDIV